MQSVVCSVVVVVVNVLVDDDDGRPGVEDTVSDDGSDRRAADDVTAIDVAAEDAVVEVVGDAVIVYWTDTRRNIHVVTEVVIVRVHIRMRFRTVVVVVSGLRLRMTLLIVSSGSVSIATVVARSTRITGVCSRVVFSCRTLVDCRGSRCRSV